MRIEFLGQPFGDNRRLGQLLGETLPAASSVWLLCAWAQMSGLKHVKAELVRLRGGGAATEAIVGIDAGFATQEALEEIMALFRSAYVFHDPGERTFHPKVYCIEKEDEVVVFIGSSNLTVYWSSLNWKIAAFELASKG